MNNLLFIVMHKEYQVPTFSPYRSISVGPNKDKFKANYRDDTEDNIANKNSFYCELTAQYWVWKNIANRYDNIGLVHYRRFFANSNTLFKKLLTDKNIQKYLSKFDIILPKKWYWNMTVAEYYYIAGQGKKKDLKTTRRAIEKYFPDYLSSFDKILSQHSASYCNMMVTNRENFKKYTEWLFCILEYVEENTDISNYRSAEARIFGYLSEILLNVWVDHNQLKVKYLPMIQKEASFKQRAKEQLQFCVREIRYKE